MLQPIRRMLQAIPIFVQVVIMPRQHYRLLPDATAAGLRLDHYVPSQVAELSRTFLRKIVDMGGVHVGGRRVRKCSTPMRCGELVEIYLDGLPLEIFSLSPQQVLFQDRFLLVVNKPAGVETQPTPARYKGTLYEALLRHLHDPYRPLAQPELGMVQRLDRETSGVMVFSIHAKAHRALTSAFTGRQVGKTYLALVQGRPDALSGEIRSQLGRSRHGNKMLSVQHGGKEAITRYRLLEAFAEASLIELELLTGRSHQIRVHCSEQGFPLLGDSLYGGPGHWLQQEIPRQMLHAASLCLTHPVTGAALELQAPLPEDMATLLATMRRGAKL